MSEFAKQYAAIGGQAGQSLDYMNALAQGAIKQPPLGSLYEALKRLNEAASFARTTADRLCGSQPESVGKEATAPGGSYFSELENIANDVRSFANRIDADMQRIQSRL